MKKIILSLIISIAITPRSFANDTTDEIALLKQQLQMLTNRINNLEAQNKKKETQTQVSESNKPSDKASWTDKISFKADIRDRYEYIDQRDKEIRQRNRMRLRAEFNMQVNDALDFGFGLASGKDDPTSTNQTLGDSFSTKDIRLDLAYFNWQLNDSLKLTGGKMKNPFYKPAKNPILWDGDLNPEGLALNYDNNFIQATIAGYSVEERKAADDTLLIAGQLIHEFKLSDSSKFITGLGYYDYQNLKGNAPLFDGKNKGNTLDNNGNIANDFNTAEIFLEYKSKLSGKPLSIYGNYYQNTAAKDLDAAFTVGFIYGKVKNPGSWNLGYAYLDVEADAILGVFNDSDFAGGNTDSKGHLIKASYGLKKNISLGLTYINSEIDQSKLTQTDYDRLQLDFKIKFK